MPDDPNQQSRDRHTISNQDFEIDHLASSLADEFPNKSRGVIEQAINQAKSDAHTNERDQVIGRARAILRE